MGYPKDNTIETIKKYLNTRKTKIAYEFYSKMCKFFDNKGLSIIVCSRLGYIGLSKIEKGGFWHRMIIDIKEIKNPGNIVNKFNSLMKLK